MTNKEIARAFSLLAKLMELQGENQFKIRSYQNASSLLSKLATPLAEMTKEEIGGLKGVGSAISGKIQELVEGGKMKTLERYKEQVPEGILELLMIRGIGAKKVKAVWEALGVENAVEMLYACNENRLIDLKGFGQITQEEIRKQLEFFLGNRANFLFANVEPLADKLVEELRQTFSDGQWAITGALRRKEPVLDKLEFLTNYQVGWPDLSKIATLSALEVTEDSWHGLADEKTPVVIYKAKENGYAKSLFQSTGPLEFVDHCDDFDYKNEEEVFKLKGRPFIPPECRTKSFSELAHFPSTLISAEHIQGVVHCHSTFSDGLHTVAEMAETAKELGYSYLALTDHSKVAVYADGMDEHKVLEQWQEIDRLNLTGQGFRIVKGIECDILSDGNLDYEDDFRKGFELVIASIHSNIKMDEKKATDRLVRAVEHPDTNILGHPTGRLLLGRDGYPCDMAKVIDACAANQVAIEINASPYRLDLDWKHIDYALARGVLLSINPDAHTRETIKNIRFGVIIARKGWLPAESCLNAKRVEDFLTFCKK